MGWVSLPQPNLQYIQYLVPRLWLGTLNRGSASLRFQPLHDNQIVDFTVRLRNLRKSEEMVLKIMERSGSVGDVLYAAQNLREIRELIERIDAQLKSLRTQVAYSTITISLEEAVAATPASQQPLGLRFQETWGKSTHAMSEFTLGLLSLSIWLFTFSPYLLLGSAAVYGYRKFRRQKSDLSAQKAELPPAVDAQSKIEVGNPN